MDRSKIYLSHYYIDSTSHKAIVEVNGTGSTSGSLRIYSLLKKS